MPDPEQIRSALALANRCRPRRAQLGREIKANEVKVSDLLQEPTLPDWLEGETASRLLCRIPKFGKTRANSLLADLHIGQLRRIGDLTYRQRRQLSDELAGEESRGVGARKASALRRWNLPIEAGGEAR
jgi:hypothetical protein